MSRIKAAIQKSGLIREGERVVVGFSGGADSMALLHALYTMGVPVVGCHVNHGLRGAESDRDEETARLFCKTHGIPFVVLHADVRKTARELGCGEEEAGREIRYAFFEETRQKYGADKI
jgi:tRNA(Ile)-lysidine synthase